MPVIFYFNHYLKISWHILAESPITKFHENLYNGQQAAPCTDKTKLTLSFCDFTNAPYKPNQKLQYSNSIYICRLVRSNASCFLFHATYKLDMWKFHRTLLQISWKHWYFQCSLHLCQQTSSTLQQKHAYQCLVKASLLPLQPHICNSLQCLTIPVMVSLQTIFWKTKQVKIWQCKIKTLWWVWQHTLSKFCDGLSGVHTCEWLGTIMKEQHFGHFSCRTSWTQ